MHLEVTHETRYDYLPPVEVAQHMAYLRPWNTVAQELLSHDLQVEPRPAQQTEAVDVYGNRRTFIALQTPHAQLRVVARSTLRTHTRPMPASTVAWEQVRERFRYRADAVYDPAAEFVFASQHVPRSTEFAAYARPSFPAGASMLDGALDLMHRIHAEFTYDNRSTQINTPAQQALAQRKGVCQDFAHIMIAGLRSMGLAARYVSGYLLTEPAPGTPRLLGSDASHAWVSVLLPDLPADARWCDFDPTNDRWGWGLPGEDYVLLALGRDYADVSPIRGVIHGGANHQLSVAVTVSRLDAPAPDLAP
ncbi:MAG: transglutaminase family protein [Rhodoferax sp.]|nr:transglutaminase family protein [Rhodoferax sp.]